MDQPLVDSCVNTLKYGLRLGQRGDLVDVQV